MDDLRTIVRRSPVLRRLAGILRRYLCRVRTFYSLRTRRFTIAHYFKSHPVRGLHLGCGGNIHAGWLNTDLFVSSRGAVALDATGRFPVPDDSLDYVYSEHMIEHISHADGLKLLKESFRGLKVGGRIRIATPNLSVLLNLHSTRVSTETACEVADYIQWFAARHMPTTQYRTSTHVINHFFYNWDHRFIYDEATLEESFRVVGFVDLKWCPVRVSNYPMLNDLERHGVVLGSERWNAFETMVLEGTKP